jgi:hypothetical protein
LKLQNVCAGCFGAQNEQLFLSLKTLRFKVKEILWIGNDSRKVPQTAGGRSTVMAAGKFTGRLN